MGIGIDEKLNEMIIISRLNTLTLDNPKFLSRHVRQKNII